MGVGKNDNETVHLVPDNMTMEQDLDMYTFKITKWNLDYNAKHEGLRVLIVMRRKVTSELMTTYLPSILLLSITLATTSFKPIFFEAALSVNLTTMLLMTTIFISKMESLPPTSDIKMIDFWLVFCQMIPFAEVVLLTVMEYKRTETDEEDINCTTVQVQVAPTSDDGIDYDIDANKCYKRFNMSLFIPSLKAMGKF